MYFHYSGIFIVLFDETLELLNLNCWKKNKKKHAGNLLPSPVGNSIEHATAVRVRDARRRRQGLCEMLLGIE